MKKEYQDAFEVESFLVSIERSALITDYEIVQDEKLFIVIIFRQAWSLLLG